MTQALLLSTLLLLGAGTGSSRSGRAKLSAAQSEFNKGDFEAALKLLAAAQTETSDDDTLAKIHLLRGQAHGAMRDLPQAEEALAQALDHDPEATLDANRVDPSLVTMMSGLKQRLRGTLEVSADRAARITFDGKVLGNSPLKAQVEIGRHRVEARTADGRYSAVKDVVIRPRRLERAELTLREVSAEQRDRGGSNGSSGSGSSGGASTGLLFGFGKPLADVRLQFDPLQWIEGVGIEIGPGLQNEYLRFSVGIRVFPQFGLTPRGAFSVPLVERIRAYVEMEVPMIVYPGLTNWFALALGGAAGVDYEVNKWLSGFAQLGARHFFLTPYEENRLTLQVGFRLQLP